MLVSVGWLHCPRYVTSRTIIEETRIWKIFAQLCAGLKAIHDLNIVHRGRERLDMMTRLDGREEIVFPSQKRREIATFVSLIVMIRVHSCFLESVGRHLSLPVLLVGTPPCLLSSLCFSSSCRFHLSLLVFRYEASKCFSDGRKKGR